jgi:hypothetical protein
VPRRAARYSAQFDAEARQIDADPRRMDEALFYVEGLLCEHPSAGVQSDTPAVWVAPILLPKVTTSGFVAASIYYTWDDTHVDFLSIRADF